MADYSLPENGGDVHLDDGYTLHTVGLRGTVQTEAAGQSRGLSSDDIDTAIENTGLRLDKVIVLPPAPGARALAAGQAQQPTATLDITVSEDQGCVLLVEDVSSGALSWVMPDNPRDLSGPGARGLATVLRFKIPVANVARAEGARGFLSDLGQKIKAYFFDITDAVLGPIIHGFAKKWETKHRPAFVRTYGPDDYHNDDSDFPRLDAAGWQRLAQGRALLFVHGTFSTCGSFAPLSTEVIGELSRRYGGRTFAFNHPTMTADPRENAIAFLSALPAGVKLEIDIVCHSRGGLVAREIAALGAAAGSVTVRRIVFVGATNAGTALADDDHMIAMIDRFTTIAKFIPQGTAKNIVDALVLVVKVLGHGFLADLEGLRAMNPHAEFISAINVAGGPTVDYFAIASDFEPKPDTPFLSLTRAEDLAMDSVFENAANDLVVPRDGVFAKNGATGFPIGDARCLKFGPADAVIHTEFFAEPRTGAQLLEWLEPSAVATRALAGPSMDEVARALDAFRDHALATLTARDGARGLAARTPAFTPADLEALRPHVVNLSEGVFKDSGIYSTTPSDVDAMVREHIPQWVQTQPADQPARIVVWAHGGLVGERDGLQVARKHVEWWKRNGVYPIYFVWETGLFDALRAILESVARKIPGLGTRDLFDFTTDPLVQEGVRALGGVQIWGAMKQSAKLASAASGGARYLAQRLNELASQGLPNQRPIEFHAVGHSAGSIFHSWFLPTARSEGVPAFTTLQLLAPAITNAEFSSRLTQRIGAGRDVERAVMYTMKKSFEEDDDCIRVYRKSLLYLIHHALEPQRRTPILGLELSVRADAAASTLFGLNGATGAPGRVVWSVTEQGDERSSSRAVHHGDFDDDAVTMNSVAANVLDEPRARVPYRSDGSRSIDGWPVADEWLEGVDLTAVGPGLRFSKGTSASVAAPSGNAETAKATASPVQAKPPANSAPSGGARRALCVGIDAYPAPNTLQGCVNDTLLWKKALEAEKFTVQVLPQRDATHANIVSSLRGLITTAKRGDVLVFQYSGHGTQVPDTDGDEDDGMDEALVPIDFDSGAFLIDDDLRAIFDLLPEGVNLTVFIDCCHSGTITRMLGRNSDGTDLRGARFLKHTDDWDELMNAHLRFREYMNGMRAMPARGKIVGRNALRWVNYSACDATEVAFEHDGNGDFTRLAVRLLSGDLTRFTHRAFQDAVIAAFGEKRRQTPQLDCADSATSLPLLQPLV